jgi:hypothetical protein
MDRLRADARLHRVWPEETRRVAHNMLTHTRVLEASTDYGTTVESSGAPFKRLCPSDLLKIRLVT